MGQINPEASSFTCINNVKSNFADCCFFSGGYAGRLRPEVQPLPTLYTIFAGKGTPFVYPLLTSCTLFTT